MFEVPFWLLKFEIAMCDLKEDLKDLGYGW
jgi:hypothetical protein